MEEEELPKGLDTSDGGEPLLELVEEEGGRLWLQGNTTLAHLTLSCEPLALPPSMDAAHSLLLSLLLLLLLLLPPFQATG